MNKTTKKKAVVKKHPAKEVKKVTLKAKEPKPLKKIQKIQAKPKLKIIAVAPKAAKTATTRHKTVAKKPDILQKPPVIKEEIPVVIVPPEKPKVIHHGAPKIKVEPAAPQLNLEEPKKEAPLVKQDILQDALSQLKELELALPINVKDLAIKLQQKPSAIIKILMGLRIMVGINQNLDEKTTTLICEKFGFKIKTAPTHEDLTLKVHQDPDKSEDLKIRAPIVTFMGHVDHGKTSLLDAIRQTKVVDAEHGGITQHIGAYRVKSSGGEITFLDTPGHEAFTAMRARGARITDIVVLVVAADDGIMPQTQEAIDHARAAQAPIIVALNKIDKPQADPDRVKKQLATLGLNPEDWGGKTIVVPVSAKTGAGIDNLLEMILLEAQMLELKSNPKKLSRGVVVEAKISKGRGPVATLLVQNGTLRLNENIIVGQFYGKIRAMFDDHARPVTEAPPSFPVEVLGISGVPQAGEQFFAIKDEKQAKELAAQRLEKEKQQQVKEVKRISLEDLHLKIQEGKIKELKIIIKSDVQGSLEAIKETINKIDTAEIKLEIIHTGVGNINSSDVVLAMASDALILGFNVVSDERAKELSSKEGIDIRIYNIIYELANDIKAALEGMLEPKLKKVFLGRAEVRKVFKLTRAGIVAGCFITKGKFNRTVQVSVERNGDSVFDGKLSSLKRFKDDVKEVAEGFECGMSISGFDTLQEGDIIQGYVLEKIVRKL